LYLSAAAFCTHDVNSRTPRECRPAPHGRHRPLAPGCPPWPA
jgi:hypothetical protein